MHTFVPRGDHLRKARAVALALPLALFGPALGCGGGVDTSPRMVQDPPPAPPDTLSSDNMPDSAKNLAKFPKSTRP